jgi:hypothetical protein
MGLRQTWGIWGQFGDYLKPGAGGGKELERVKHIPEGRGRVSVRSIATHRLGDNGGQAGEWCTVHVATKLFVTRFAHIHRKLTGNSE